MDYSKEKPTFTFPNDGGRPIIRQYATQPKFRPNDQVYICASGNTAKQGPFTVMSLDENLKLYKLCDAQGGEVERGKSFEEINLELYNPFE